MNHERIDADITAGIYNHGAIPLYRYDSINLRFGTDRRILCKDYMGAERRSGKERRQDADWRFSLIRRNEQPWPFIRISMPVALN